MNTKLGAYVIAILATLAVMKTVRIYRENRLSTRLFLMWLIIWFIIGFASLFPSTLDTLMRLANMGNRIFFLTTGAILILYMIIFYITSNISRTNRKISKLVQEIAILEYKLKYLSRSDKNF